MPPLKIFVYAHLDEAGQSLLGTELPTKELVLADKHLTGASHEAQLKAFQHCDICFGNVPAKWLQQAPRLRWLQLESVGFEYYQQVENLPPALIVTNLKGMFAQPAAETILAGLLAFYRGVPALVSAQTARRWVCLEVRPKMQLLHGRRLVILGHGSIGRKLRQLLVAFDCQVQSFARTAPEAELHTLAELDQALARAEIVLSCLPNTPETRGLIDRRRLNLLSSQAVFANIGRGSVVDEAALIEALQLRRIGGAVLDVTMQEPLPDDHPLWSCPETILLQHTGGGYNHELLDKARTFLANLARYRKGEPVLNQVSLANGY